MQKRLIILLPLLLLLGACSSFRVPMIPGVYKIPIQQGNVIEQHMIDTLRPGMTKRQVRFVMGTPLLVDPFESDRWDYIYSFQPGGGQRTQEQIALYFTDNKLTHFTGHFRPTANLPEEGDDKDEREVSPEDLLEQEEELDPEEEDSTFQFLKF